MAEAHVLQAMVRSHPRRGPRPGIRAGTAGRRTGTSGGRAGCRARTAQGPAAAAAVAGLGSPQHGLTVELLPPAKAQPLSRAERPPQPTRQFASWEVTDGG